MVLDEPEDLKQELKDSRDRLNKAYNNLKSSLSVLTLEFINDPFAAGLDPLPNVKRADIVNPFMDYPFIMFMRPFLAYRVLMVQKSIDEIETELFNINEIMKVFFRREIEDQDIE